jgi:hypothetical protein
MNQKISWDHSLVKKYSSSNHFKLLNQLRTEVEKYPLIKKKIKPEELTNENISDSKLYLNRSSSQDFSTSVNPISSEENKDGNKSTVSFNNSKNFSIYKNMSNNSIKQDEQTNIFNSTESNDEKFSTSFKDRLNQVDMK